MPENDTEEEIPQDFKTVGVVALVVVLILTIAIFAAYRYSKNRTGTVVLPGGITYLGPTPTQAPPKSGDSSTIAIPANTNWVTYNGKIFPYNFLYPSSLSLGVFYNDPFDSVTIFWGNTNPQENLLLRVEDLNKIPNMTSYISKSKKEYAQNWWKQYSYKSVSSITQFTNSKGMDGYRTKFVNADGSLSSDNVFFEVPGRPELVIWMSTRLLSQTTFDKIVDSLSWKSPEPTK